VECPVKNGVKKEARAGSGETRSETLLVHWNNLIGTAEGEK
jgi:hypothetical protein